MRASRALMLGFASAALVACSNEPKFSKPVACAVTHRNGTDKTEYMCANARAAKACEAGDVTHCEPMTRARGTVAPGGKCTREEWGPEGKAYELGSNCAPVPSGSACVMESGPGAYCTHDCAATSDCADLRRDGFHADCSGGMCLLTRNGG